MAAYGEKGPISYNVSFTQAHNNLVSLLERADIHVAKSVAFVNDPEQAVKELKVR